MLELFLRKVLGVAKRSLVKVLIRLWKPLSSIMDRTLDEDVNKNPQLSLAARLIFINSLHNSKASKIFKSVFLGVLNLNSDDVLQLQ